MPDRLVQEQGPTFLPPIELVRECYRVGRSNDNDLILAAPEVSRHHAEIQRTPKGWVIKDQGARNPVLINDKPAGESRLMNADEIRFGPYVFRFFQEGTGISSPTTTAVTLLAGEADRALPEGTIRRAARPEQALAEGRLKSLYEASAELTRLAGEHELHQFLARVLVERMGATRCAIGKPLAEDFKVLAARDARSELPPERMKISRTVLKEVLDSGEAILVPQLLSDDRFSAAVSLVEARVSSVMCMPLMIEEKLEAVLYLERVGVGRGFTEDDLEFLTAVSRLAGLSIENSRLLESEKERQRIIERINVAREIQQRMFPESLPDDPRLGFAGVNLPSDQVSGDWYDVVQAGPDVYMATLADVTGKGVPAAMVTASLEAAFRLLSRTCHDPAQCLRQLNEVLVDSTPMDTFATMVMVWVNAADGKVRLASAGHNYSIVAAGKDQKAEFIDFEGGLPLAVLAGTTYENYELILEKGQTLLMYSDGVTEAMDRHENQFEDQRLLEAAGRSSARSAGEILAAVQKAVSEFVGDAKQSDDLTMLAIQRLGT